jgi:hypothetical protein
LAIEAGNAFVWKPMAMSGDEKIRFSWGGPILITKTGCESLFTGEHGMVSID